MLLKGWSNKLPPEIVQAIESGEIIVYEVVDKKLGVYQLLKGETKIGNTVFCFK